MRDLSGDVAHSDVRRRLTKTMVDQLHGNDREWLKDGELVGLPDREWQPQPDTGLHMQRGLRFM